MKAPFVWDRYSNQPYQLKDRAFKKKIRRRHLGSLIMTVLTALVFLPLSYLLIPFLRRRKIGSEHFFGMSVNLDKEPQLTPELIEELGIKTLLIRLPLWEMDRFDEYIGFIKQFQDKKLIINIMQDREHIEDPRLFKKHITAVFESLSPYAATFQIGSTINRAKWGFFSVNQYLAFYQTAYEVKKSSYPDLKLIGPSVIDFEYHFTAHALFNLVSLRYDALSALLYVDRRGAPENTQMGFDLTRKINLLASMARLSPKTGSGLYLTETNWPLTGTAPYAPTSEHECIDEEAYADFMVRYYLLAFASQQVDAVFWHQLIAPGYGLIDNREGIRKRSAFTAFKTMYLHLAQATFSDLHIHKDRYTLECLTPRGPLHVIWSLQAQTITFDSVSECLSRDNTPLNTTNCIIGSSPVYVYLEK